MTRRGRIGWWALLVAGLLLYVAMAAGLLGEEARGALLWLFGWPGGGQ